MLEFQETYELSFPRRRESGISMPQEFIGKNQNPSAVIPTESGNLEMKRQQEFNSEMTETRTDWIPSFAGMTATGLLL
ncbi:hypothetical protein NM70012_1341 [Neisseria meningitidis 70012]|nr:hypothetical protein NM70012_1341 [Neisseria meningitidis 70012]